MSRVLAKTDGTSLEAHTQHVVDEARRWLNAFSFLEAKYRAQTGEDLRAQLLKAAEMHDQGKRHPTWQDACRKDARGGGGRNLMTANLRHEFASLDYARKKDIDLTLPERAAVAAHHGKLGYRHEHRWLGDANGQFEDIWEDLWATANRWTMNPPPDLSKKALDERFRIAGVRALLRIADTRASIQEKEKENWVPDPSDLRFAYDFPYDDPRGVQEAVKGGWDDPAMILRAPTGSGKTDASLLWAEHQIEKLRADRCVIAMPTRFTSNSLALDVKKNVSETGLYHSSAWFARYRDEDADPEAEHRAREMHRMARLLATPVTVCTIDHLCASLTGTREDHFSTFYHLCNSCVVVDEADFYDPFVQANLQVLLRVLRHFDVPVLVMSATVPDAATSFYGIDTLAEDDSDLSRTRCRIRDAGPAEAPEDVAERLHAMVEGDQPAGIVYANTVKRALAYYDWFRENTCVEPILYHSRFTEPDKKRIERRLLDALGQKAWKEGTACGIAILTQIGEMSLNISAPVMVSELCPYDRLAQRAGRLGRFKGMGVGDLYVVEPMKNGELYPAPYGEYEQGGRAQEGTWVPGRTLVETKETLQFGPHSAQDFIDAIDALYPDDESFAPTDDRIQLNRRRLEQHLKQDWLIVNAQQFDEDEESTEEWKSRDIPPTRTVLTACPDQFESYAAYRAFEQEHGVSVPNYQIEKGQHLSRMPPEKKTFDVADEEERAWYTPVYSRTEGLILDQKRERSRRDRFV